MSEQTKTTLRQALSKIQGDKSLWVEKGNTVTIKFKRQDGTWSEKSYKSFTENGVYEAIKGYIAESGLSVNISRESGSTAQIYYSEQLRKWIYQAPGVLTLGVGDEYVMLPIDLVGANEDPSKAMGTALTYAMKYWLCKNMLLPNEELDSDTDHNSLIVENKASSGASQPKVESQLTIGVADGKTARLTVLASQLIDKVKTDTQLRLKVTKEMEDKCLANFQEIAPAGTPERKPWLENMIRGLNEKEMDRYLKETEHE